MSRRKQARPIRVLESEEGSNAGNLPVLDLANGDGSSEAEDGSGGSLSESEDEDAANDSILEMQEDRRESPDNSYPTGMDFINAAARHFQSHPIILDSNGGKLNDKSTGMFEVFPNLLKPCAEKPNEASSGHFDVLPNLLKASFERLKGLENERLNDNECEDNTCNPATLHEVAMLQTTLIQLQRQQMVQINLIEQLRHQLQSNKSSTRSSSPVQQCEMETVASNPNNNNNNISSNNNDENVGSSSNSNNNDNQSTLFQLQSQHILQMSLIKQLQNQLQLPKSSTRSSSPIQQCETENISSNDNNNNNSNNVPIGLPLVVPRISSPKPIALTAPKPSRTPTPVKQEPNAESPIRPLYQLPSSVVASGHQAPVKMSPSPPPVMSSQSMASLPLCSVSPAFASSIITNFDPPPSPSEPNSLEMLQRRTQEVLENATQGSLVNNLADDLMYRRNGANGKGGSLSPYDSKGGGRNEPFFKHRCRYCGKVFGSDSALQIHIRSHTGERPFKCNVCGSRFTTKGNLKVHFQRHTSKFPNVKMNPNPIPEHLDKLHPPIETPQQNTPPGSQPTFTNIPLFDRGSFSYGDVVDLKMHFERHTPPKFPGFNLTPPQLSEHLDKYYSPLPLLAPVNHLSSMPPGISPSPHLNLSLAMDGSTSPVGGYSMDSKSSNDVEGERDTKNLGEAMGSDDSLQEQPENLSNKSIEGKFDHGDDHRNSPSPLNSERDISNVVGAPTAHSEESLQSNEDHQSADGDHDINSTPAINFSEESLQDYNEDQQSADGEQDNTSTATVIAPSEDSLQEQPENLSNKIRGNTTCNICYKTFACNSALEIHYRSHTKERPFKCNVCDRGFSTKHLLTHKPPRFSCDGSQPQFFDKSALGSVSMPSSVVDETSNTSTESKDTTPNSVASLRACVPALDNLAASLHKVIAPSLNVLAPPMSGSVVSTVQKRSPNGEASTPPPIKRQSNSSKHLCQLCSKNFSSSSALQIHMRTHTGDKPFQCHVCSKAFTTKGNLKVHMGTHMWTNHTSRRGRRMSLEVPATYKTKDSLDVFNRRPDFAFYPYLAAAAAAPYLNGMQKNITNGLYPYAYHSNLSNLKRSGSPISPSITIGRHLSLDSHSSPSPWDLHFERKAVDEHVEAKTPSPPHPSHKEGLAA